MLIRRCGILFFEPRENIAFSLAGVLAGASGVARTIQWVALAPHLAEPVVVDARQRELLGALSPSHWVDAASCAASSEELAWMVSHGLVLAQQESTEAGAHLQRDQSLRDANWHPLAALLHAFTRWEDVDSVGDARSAGTDTAAGMRHRLGPPPGRPMLTGEGIALPTPLHGTFDALLQRRTTCRNFDVDRPLPMALFSTMLGRVFGSQAEVEAGGLVFAKKNSPSGGGLHPIEACVMVQNVEGVAPGLYRYAAREHRLHPIALQGADLRELVRVAVSQQEWFVGAHCLVMLVASFDQTFWKYRRHAKGYRVVTLEAGHLSQSLYLSATDLGLGAFITGAINEKPLERALGLDPMREGVLAICGFGWRAGVMQAAELDPLHRTWPPSA